jgi:hypothetical protein
MSSEMNETVVGPPPPGGDAQAYYQQLFDSLKQAYLAANTVEAKDEIFDTRETVYEILTAISQSKLDGNTAQLEALSDTVEKNNDDLEDLKEKIAKIVTDTQVAANVVNSISHVLSLAGDFI